MADTPLHTTQLVLITTILTNLPLYFSGTFLSHNTPDASLYFTLVRCVISSSISSFFLDNRRNLLETSSYLNDLRIKSHFHVNLNGYTIEFAFQLFYLDSTQPEHFSFYLSPNTSNLALTPPLVSSIITMAFENNIYLDTFS